MKTKNKKQLLASGEINTDEGVFLAHYSEAGLAELDFPNGRKQKSGTGLVPSRQWHKLTTRAVQNVLAGKKTGPLPPLDISAGTDFQRKVWKALVRIRCGRTKTYSGLAQSLRKPKAARAVGGACGANPIPLLIPCHRVLAAGGKLGGFSGGLSWKRKLLEREHGVGKHG